MTHAGSLMLALLLTQTLPQEHVTRAYDLGGLLSIRGRSRWTFDLCPATPSGRVEESGAEEEIETPFYAPQIQDLLNAIVDRRWGKAAARITIAGDVLVVSATAAINDEIGGILARLETACLGDERLELRVFSGPGVLEVPLLLDEAESVRRVLDLLAAGARVIRAGEAALQDGLVTRLGAVDTERLVRDWDTEIAHGSAIFDPVVDVDEVGLAARVRAARTRDGTYLDLAIRESEAEPPRERALSPVVKWAREPSQCGDEQHASPHAAAREPTPITIELPAHRFTSWAGSFVLPNGKVLWIPCRVRTHAGDVSCAFELRVTGACRPQRQALEPGADTGASEIVLLHVGSLQAAGLDMPPIRHRSLPISRWTRGSDEEWAWPSRIETRPLAPKLGEALRILLPDAETDSSLRVDFLSPRHLVLQTPDEVTRRIETFLTEREGPGAAFEISGRVLAKGEVLSEFRLPALAGKLTTLWSGLAGAFLADWDVDVACGCCIAKPQIGWALDGLALQFVVRPAGSDRLQLVARGKVLVMLEPPTVEELGNPYAPFYERLKSRALEVDETAVVSRREPRTLRFGDDELAVELTVEPL